MGSEGVKDLMSNMEQLHQFKFPDDDATKFTTSKSCPPGTCAWLNMGAERPLCT